MTLAELVAHVGAKKVGSEYRCLCPNHEDKQASLGLRQGDHQPIIIKCRAGCRTEDVLAKWNLTIADISSSNGNGHRTGHGTGSSSSRSPVIATYDYADRDGVVRYQKQRTAKKDFFFRKPDGRGGWIGSKTQNGGTAVMDGVDRLLYRVHDLREQSAAGLGDTFRIYVVEGEKDADRLWSLGLPATTNDAGASEDTRRPKWTEPLTQQLQAIGATEVACLPDNDDPGRAHMQAVARSCTAAGLTVRIVPLPGLTEKQDVSDWLNAGHTVDELLALVEAIDPRAPTIGADAIPDPPPGEEDRFAESYRDFRARLRARRPPADLVPSLIPGVGIVMPHGQPRSLKTWIALELARALATADAAFGLERFRVTTPRRTWYLTEEDPELEILKRFQCLFAGRPPHDDPDTLTLSVQKAINLDDPDWQRAILAYGCAHQFEVTIFDPIRSLSGAVDQGPDKVRPLSQFLRRYMRDTGSVVLLNHHDTKPMAGKPDDRAKPQRASGGGIFSIADAPIHVELVGTDERRTIVTPSHYKFSVAPDPFIVTLESDDPKTPTWVRLTGEATSATSAATLALHQCLSDYLRAHPHSSGSAVAKGVHKSKEEVLDALGDLRRNGLADFHTKGKSNLWALVTGSSV